MKLGDYSSWVASKIEEHAPDQAPDITAATRLVDAAIVLQSNGEGQLFGLQVSTSGLSDRERLLAKACEVISLWLPALPDGWQRDELVERIRTHELDVAVGEVAPEPEVAIRLQFYLGTEVANSDDESDSFEETVEDAGRLASLDGVRPFSTMGPADVGVGEAFDAEKKSRVGLFPQRFIVGSEAVLRFDKESSRLFCVFTFDCSEEPGAIAVEALNR
ncbi:MAG: hypothetical protein AAF658_10900, partial [Myxococcota bacterium]